MSVESHEVRDVTEADRRQRADRFLDPVDHVDPVKRKERIGPD